MVNQFNDDTYGNVVGESDPSIDCLDGFTFRAAESPSPRPRQFLDGGEWFVPVHMRGIFIVLSMLLLMYLAVLVVLRESFGYDRKDIRGDEMKYPVPPTVRTDFVCRRPSDTVSLNMASPRRLADKPCSFFCKGVALMPQGTIKKVIADKGFGFIESDKGDLFFHHSDLEGATIEALEIGQQVIYEEGQSPKGPCAQQVRPA